jgi:cell shape-determining protein MreC
MDILRNLFGNLTSGLIRLLVTVGILAAAYFFIVKPVLSTTEEAIDSANRNFGKTFGTPGADITDVGKTIEDVNKRVEREVRRSFRTAERKGGRDSQRLVRCIRRAHGNTRRIQHCTAKF